MHLGKLSRSITIANLYFQIGAGLAAAPQVVCNNVRKEEAEIRYSWPKFYVLSFWLDKLTLKIVFGQASI